MNDKLDYLSPDEERKKTYLFFKKYLTEDEQNELHGLMDRPHAPAEGKD